MKPSARGRLWLERVTKNVTRNLNLAHAYTFCCGLGLIYFEKGTHEMSLPYSLELARASNECRIWDERKLISTAPEKASRPRYRESQNKLIVLV